MTPLLIALREEKFLSAAHLLHMGANPNVISLYLFKYFQSCEMTI